MTQYFYKLYLKVKTLLLLCFPIVCISQTPQDTTSLSEVIVLSTLIKKELQETTMAVSVLTEKELQQTDGVLLTSLLNKTPGVLMEQGALNTNRITIRGIGSRSQYSTNRVKAYFEEIPLSNAEGETVIEDIDLETLGKVEIIKGPNATTYGSGLGGVITLFGKSVSDTTSSAKARLTAGSFELIKQSYSAGIGLSDGSIFTNYSNLKTDGFRENSGYNRKSFHIQANYNFGSKHSLTYLGVFTRLKAFIASSLNFEDFTNQPENAATNWAEAQGYESYDKLLLGVAHTFRVSESWNIKSSVFLNYKDAYEPRPFDILDDTSSGMGFRVKINYKNQLFSFPFEASLGSEYLTENYSFSLFENLYQSIPENESVEGDEFSSIKQKRSNTTLFLQMETRLSERLLLEKGVSFNETRYTLQDVFQQPQNPEKQTYTFGNIWTPRVGVSYKLARGKNIYASVSNGYSVPTVAETLTPEGQINTSLLPEKGTNYEAGIKLNWFANALYTEVNVFSTQIKNLLVARRVAEDQYVGINAGESSHSGVEFLVHYNYYTSSGIQINPFVSGNINHFKFEEFIDEEQDFSGNQLTGTPKYKWTAGLNILTPTGFAVNVLYNAVGEIPLNDANDLYSESYELMNLKSTYTFQIKKDFEIQLSAGVNNLFDEQYAASILPNAVSFGNAAPRYYYPGNPRNYFGGISLNYLF
ncbi:TonB-dependent receptor [Planktosalinus lacus]|uniref:TonB-dependent receptor n=1 Tax=Planktosalinus lacus TaxID=1526573 RepID=A0A8J2Y5Z9_9FLAO|nr:TonB-dependent receptor [Planktosalinus lacus]